MTAKDSADQVLGYLTEAGATAAWKIANVVLSGCGLNHAVADLQGFGILKTKLDTSMPQTPVKFLTDVLQTPESQLRKVAACPKKTRIKSKKATVKPILGRINAPRLPNERYQRLQPPALLESLSACLSPTTSLTAVAATWTSTPDATSTSQTMSSLSTTPSSFDLVTLINSTIILDHLKSNLNLELNLEQNRFC